MADETVSEIWLPIDGFPGYEVSSLGRVRSLDRYVLWSNCRNPRFILGRILSQRNGRYKEVNLGAEGRNQKIHVLVCIAFHGPRPTAYEIAHWDGNPHNNSADNLRWATLEENASDRLRHGRDTRGEKNKRAILSNDDVGKIWQLINRTSLPLTAIAKRFGVTKYTIWSIKHRKNWRWLTSDSPPA